MTPPFLILLALTVAINAGLGIIVPMAPNYLKDAGFSTYALSAPFLALVAARVISKAWVGRLLRFASHRWLLFASFGIYTMSFLVYPTLDSTWSLTSVRVLEGIAEGIASAILLDLAIALTSSSPKRGELMGYFSAAFGLGLIVGPIIGMFGYSHFGARGAFYSGALVGVLGAIATFAFSATIDRRPGTSDGLRAFITDTWNYRRLLPYYSPQLLRRALFFGFMIILPLTAREVLRIDTGEVGNLFVLSALITTLSMPIAGKLADRWSPRRIVVAGIGIMSIALIGLGMTADPLAFAALFGAETLAFSLMLPAGMKVFADAVQAHPERSNIVGVFGSVAEASTVVVALVLPPLFSLAPAVCWATVGIACALCAGPFLAGRPTADELAIRGQTPGGQ